MPVPVPALEPEREHPGAASHPREPLVWRRLDKTSGICETRSMSTATLRSHPIFPGLLVLWLQVLTRPLSGVPFDAAPFGLPLPEGNGVMWEDPR